MNIGEFKAFLEGMGVGDAPTPEQWAKIMEKVDQLQSPDINFDQVRRWPDPGRYVPMYADSPGPKIPNWSPPPATTC